MLGGHKDGYGGFAHLGHHGRRCVGLCRHGRCRHGRGASRGRVGLFCACATLFHEEKGARRQGHGDQRDDDNQWDHGLFWGRNRGSRRDRQLHGGLGGRAHHRGAIAEGDDLARGDVRLRPHGRHAGSSAGSNSSARAGPLRRTRLQRLGELTHGLVSFGRLLRQCVQNDRFEIWRNVPDQLSGRLRNLGHVLVQDPHEGLGQKGQPAGSQLVQDDAEGVDVDAMISILALGLLRGHVVGRAEDDSGLGLLRLSAVEPGELGDAEVQDLHEVFAPGVVDQEHVLRLEVPVDDSLGMGGGQSVTDLNGHFTKIPPGEPAKLLEPVGQVGALQVLHHEEDTLVLSGAKVGDVHDVLVTNSARRLGLADEARDHFAAVGELLVEHLQGDLFLDDHMLGQVYDPHPPLPQQLEDAVPIRQYLPDQRCRIGLGQIIQPGEPTYAFATNLRRGELRARFTRQVYGRSPRGAKHRGRAGRPNRRGPNRRGRHRWGRHRRGSNGRGSNGRGSNGRGSNGCARRWPRFGRTGHGSRQGRRSDPRARRHIGVRHAIPTNVGRWRRGHPGTGSAQHRLLGTLGVRIVFAAHIPIRAY